MSRRAQLDVTLTLTSLTNSLSTGLACACDGMLVNAELASTRQISDAVHLVLIGAELEPARQTPDAVNLVAQ